MMSAGGTMTRIRGTAGRKNCRNQLAAHLLVDSSVLCARPKTR
jgi:hypothetical protein